MQEAASAARKSTPCATSRGLSHHLLLAAAELRPWVLDALAQRGKRSNTRASVQSSRRARQPIMSVSVTWTKGRSDSPAALAR